MNRQLLTILLVSSLFGCSTYKSSKINDSFAAPKIYKNGVINISVDDNSASLNIQRNFHFENDASSRIFCDDSIYAKYLKQRFLNSTSTLSFMNKRRSKREMHYVQKSLDNEATHVARSQLNHPSYQIKVSGLPVEYNAKVEKWLNYFTGAARNVFLTWLVRAESMKKIIVPILMEKGLPPELTNMAMIESGFNTKAFSRAKASGTWQFMSLTGKSYDLQQDFWIDERRDPIKSTVAAGE